MITLQDVKDAQPKWFSPENKRFFGDVNYFVRQGQISKKPFFIQSTYMWSDMFGGKKTLVYRVHTLKDDLKMDALVDDIFKTKQELETWLEEN
jgi:hypothetical protein